MQLLTTAVWNLQVPGALHALESLGGALEDHLQLLLPALVRLICSGKLSHLGFRSCIWGFAHM